MLALSGGPGDHLGEARAQSMTVEQEKVARMPLEGSRGKVIMLTSL
jgi:hypothetical protein